MLIYTIQNRSRSRSVFLASGLAAALSCAVGPMGTCSAVAEETLADAQVSPADSEQYPDSEQKDAKNPQGWWRFLGPDGSSTSQAASIPSKWSDTENIRWKAELPGLGVSSPIVVSGKVFVTSYSGYGTGGENQSMSDLRRHLTCFDAIGGEQLWNKTIEPVLPEDDYRPPGVTAHGYASHTPVSDGEHVFAFFGKTGLIAFDLQGNEVWRQSVGTGSGPMAWGSAASPIVYQNDAQKLVIVNASDESESLVAFDAATGKEVWKTEAGNLQNSWSTPNLVQTGERTDLIVMVPGEVWGMNPETGKLRWYSRGTTDNSTSASPVVVDQVVYAVGGRSGDAVAVKAGGKGDVNETHVLWDATIAGRFASPVAHQGHLFVFNDGVLSCYDAKTGDRVKQKRLGSARSGGDRPGGPSRGGRGAGGRGAGGRGRGGFGQLEYATPVLVGDRLIITTSGGAFHVVKANPEMDVVSTNQLTDESGFPATPAVSQGRLYLRSKARLYCVGENE